MTVIWARLSGLVQRYMQLDASDVAMKIFTVRMPEMNT